MSKWSRYAPLCGVIFVGALVGSFALSGSTPEAKASGAKVIAFYTAHRSAQQNGGFLGMYAVVFFLFFAAAFRAHVRRVAPESGPLAALSFAGAVLLAAGGAINSALAVALSDVPGALSPGAAQALNVLGNDVFIPLAAGASVFMIASGLAILRHRVLPVWLGWIALVIGVADLTPVGFIGFLVLMGWVLVVSILVVVRQPAAAREAAPDEVAAVTA